MISFVLRSNSGSWFSRERILLNEPARLQPVSCYVGECISRMLRFVRRKGIANYQQQETFASMISTLSAGQGSDKVICFASLLFHTYSKMSSIPAFYRTTTSWGRRYSAQSSTVPTI